MLDSGFVGTGSTRIAIGGVLAIAVAAPWAFADFGIIPQSAKKFSFSPEKTKVLTITSIQFGAPVYAMLSFATASVVPQGYFGWPEYIATPGSLKELQVLATFSDACQLLGNAGVLLLGTAVIGAISSGVCGSIWLQVD